MKISVVIPAHNEEMFLGECLASIERARARVSVPIEVIVCLNRCTDRTEMIARGFGAAVVREEAKCLAKIRNTGAKAASGDVIVTIDADSRMSPNMFNEIEAALLSGRFVGGGTVIRAERLSLGILMSSLVIMFYALRFGFRSAGLFWCWRKDFDAIGGFDERLATLEDLDFAGRLAAHGKTKGLRYGTLWRTHIVTSCRKFDKFGDWYFFKNPGVVRRLFTGTNQELASKFYYEFEH